MWRWIQKRLALRSYRKQLGPALVRRYGREKSYTVNQVRVTAETLGMNMDFVCYALAEYCAQDAFDAHHAAAGEHCDWTGMRQEIEASWGVGHHHATEHGFGDSHHGADDGGHHHDGGHHDGGGGGHHH